MEVEIEKTKQLVSKVHASLYQDGGENYADHSALSLDDEETHDSQSHHRQISKLEPTSLSVKKERPDSRSTMPTTLHKQRGSSTALSAPKDEEDLV